MYVCMHGWMDVCLSVCPSVCIYMYIYIYNIYPSGADVRQSFTAGLVPLGLV